MDDAERVKVRQGRRQVLRHPLGFRFAELAGGGDGIEQVTALREKIGNSWGVSHAAAHYCATVPKRHTTHFDQLQDQAEDASGVDDVVQFDDVRVPQSTQYLHFTFQHNFFALSFR